MHKLITASDYLKALGNHFKLSLANLNLYIVCVFKNLEFCDWFVSRSSIVSEGNNISRATIWQMFCQRQTHFLNGLNKLLLRFCVTYSLSDSLIVEVHEKNGRVVC